MQRKRLILFMYIVVSLLGLGHLFAEGEKIEGIVQTEDGAKLGGVSVWINNTEIRTITDVGGYYVLFPKVKGSILVTAFLDGFEMAIEPVTVETGKTMTRNFILRTKELEYEITVTQEIPKLMEASENIGVVSITPEQVAALPTLGEQDIFRSIQLMPGVSASNESSAGLYVRGGRPDENLVSYDGITIYHVDHFFGIFSAFNANAIDEVKLYKGGFESKYGGRISSVMELTGKNGNEERFSAGGGINFLSFNAFTEIPLGEKGSVFLAGRKSFQSSLYDKILDKYNDTTTVAPSGGTPPGGMGRRPGGKFQSEPTSYFYDLNGKLLYKPSKKDVLSLSVYNGMDDLDNSRDIEIPSFMADRAAEMGFDIDVSGNYDDYTEWGNTGLALNWMRQWSDIFSTNATVSYSRYFNDKNLNSTMSITRTSIDGTGEGEEDENPVRNIDRVSIDTNKLNDVTFRLGNVLKLGESNRLEFGLQVTSNDITYSYGSTNFKRPEESGENDEVAPPHMLEVDEKGTQYTGYLQDKFTLFNRVTLTPGIRATYFDLTEKYYMEPRFSLVIDVTENIKLKGAWGKYYQFANNLVREDILQGDRDFWMLADEKNVPVSSAVHYIAGISFENKNFLFDIEGYYKDLKDLSQYAFRFTPGMQEIDYNDFFYQGTGTAKGIEFLVQKKYGKYTGWFCYTLGNVEYDIPELGDDPFPASHDVTHEFKWVNSYNIKKWTFAATWIFATGRPYTEPMGATEEVFYNEQMDREIVRNIIEYGPKNGARLPDYHRLDLSATYDFKLGGTDLSAGVSVFNVYNRQNVWRKEYDVVEGELIETDVTYMGITPSLFIKIRF